MYTVVQDSSYDDSFIFIYSEIEKLEKEKEHIRTETNKTRYELKSAEVLNITVHLLFEYNYSSVSLYACFVL